MPADYLANPLIFLSTTIIGVYVFILITRVLLQFSGADSRNPISLFIIRATRVPVKILSPVLPTFKNINLSAIAIAFILQLIIGYILFSQLDAAFQSIFFWALAELLTSFINIFTYSIFITIILSWINPGTYNPAVSLLYKITEPVIKLFSKIIPPMGGIDLSPMAAMLALQILKMLLIPPLHALM